MNDNQAQDVANLSRVKHPHSVPTADTVTSIAVQFSVGKSVVTLPVLVQDGRINVTVLAYLHWMLVHQAASPRNLARHSLSMQRFCAYWLRHGEAQQGTALLRGFFEALVVGDPALGWVKLQHRSAVLYFEAVNMFADWLMDEGKSFLSSESEAVHPNPRIERRLGWYQQLASMQRQVKTNMLAHLYPSTRRGRGVTKQRRVDPRRDHGRKGSSTKQGSAWGKAMDFEEFNRLIRNERNIRDLLLWLLLGAGGLRLSEPLHLFCTDIRAEGREAEVLLAHPSEGAVPTVSASGQSRLTFRRAYLDEQYRLTPRHDLPLSHSLHAGWKGMAIEDQENMCSRVTWLLPMYGVLFWRAHQQYMKMRSRIADRSHPYYFVNLRRNIGAPLTYENAKATLERLTSRLAIRGHRNPHSLRHMYGHTMENRFGLPLHVVQRAMHHVSPESTVIYTEPAARDVRRQLEAAQKREGLSQLNNLPSLENAL